MLLFKLIALLVVLLFSVRRLYGNYTSQKHGLETIKLIIVLFRHGERTSDTSSLYPNDPYINNSHYPYGPGQLSKEGKIKMFSIGKALRNRYDIFLEQTYLPGMVYGRSTSYDRTKASLQLVLAGLFPPKGTPLEWNDNLNWNPIPYHYSEQPEDKLLMFSMIHCDAYIKLNKATTKEAIEVQNKYSSFYSYVGSCAGTNTTNLFHLARICDILITQKEWGFKMPLWVTNKVIETCKEALIDLFTFGSGTPQLKKLSGGFLLNKMLTDVQLKIEGKLLPNNRKIFLYSAHDINLAYLLNALNIYTPHRPPYGAYVLFELHEINGVYGVKVFYQCYTEKNPTIFKIPGCDYFCPIKQLKTLLQDNIQDNDNACNLKPIKER